MSAPPSPQKSSANGRLPQPQAPGRASTGRRTRWRTFRAALLLLFVFIWLFVAYRVMRPSVWRKARKPKIVHADRYSDQYKYRPAASPVITETLRDGTILLRGAFQDPYQQHDEL